MPHSAFSGQVQLAKLNCLKPIFAILEKPQEEKGHATDPRMKFFGLACLSHGTAVSVLQVCAAFRLSLFTLTVWLRLVRRRF